MKVSHKIEGDKLIVCGEFAGGVDQDKDGQMSVKGAVSLSLELDGSEVVDEMMKSAPMLQKMKEKLGVV